MNKINIGLIGYGVVGAGLVQLLRRKDDLLRNKFNCEFNIKTVCDRSIHRKDTRGVGKAILTKNYQDVLDNKDVDVIIELIGGLYPSKEIVYGALKRGKHVVTANKMLIATHGKELFELAVKQNRHLYFESSVGAGTPIINMITDGLAGNKFSAVYGIINGTCNFILSQMTDYKVTFGEALKEAQKRGFAESNPTLDINGMDSVHKLAILVYLTFGKFIRVDQIYREGITHISHDDIEHAEQLGLAIKLLAIAKKANDRIEARVHPTLIPKDHPLASIDGIYNALYLKTSPLGDILLSGEGAGQMTAASGVLSDLIHLASSYKGEANLLCNLYAEASNVKISKIDQVKTRFYIRFMASDKPGVLSKITGVLGKHGISINSVTQIPHKNKSVVPVIMLTDYAKEKMVKLALDRIYKLLVVKSKPVAIRMEYLG